MLSREEYSIFNKAFKKLHITGIGNKLKYLRYKAIRGSVKRFYILICVFSYAQKNAVYVESVNDLRYNEDFELINKNLEFISKQFAKLDNFNFCYTVDVKSHTCDIRILVNGQSYIYYFNIADLHRAMMCVYERNLYERII